MCACLDAIQATFTQVEYSVKESTHILAVCLDVMVGMFTFERNVSITFFTLDGSAIGEVYIILHKFV